MPTHDEIVEVMASDEAAFLLYWHVDNYHLVDWGARKYWRELPDEDQHVDDEYIIRGKNHYRKTAGILAAAALSALEAAGMRVVPAEPTEAMIEAGIEAYHVWEDPRCVEPIYAAMLAADGK